MSTLKRPHSPTPLDATSSKKPRGTTIVVLGNLSNGKRIELDGDPSTITPHDVYKAVKADSESDACLDLQVVSSNSYDFCNIRCEIEGSKQILVAEVNEAEKEVRSTKRKEHLSAIMDKW